MRCTKALSSSMSTLSAPMVIIFLAREGIQLSIQSCSLLLVNDLLFSLYLILIRILLFHLLILSVGKVYSKILSQILLF